jgi:N-acetylglucosaminyl-diphospho-decaprenol L-rhamnosyltransferase
MSSQITISVVSHEQATLVGELLSDLHAHCEAVSKVVLTINIEEQLPFDATRFKFPVVVIRNTVAQGFATNHNAAFNLAQTEYFCVLNPDVRLALDPFLPLLDQLRDSSIGVVAPLVLDPLGKVEYSARKFPTPFSILKKMLSGSDGRDYEIGTIPVFPDWVGGMFLLFRSASFSAVGGFDERYFLYYEDVDICWRMRQHGLRASLVPTASVTHDARRRSHRDPRYLLWHLTSMLRFFGRRALRF